MIRILSGARVDEELEVAAKADIVLKELQYIFQMLDQQTKESELLFARVAELKDLKGKATDEEEITSFANDITAGLQQIGDSQELADYFKEKIADLACEKLGVNDPKKLKLDDRALPILHLCNAIVALAQPAVLPGFDFKKQSRPSDEQISQMLEEVSEEKQESRRAEFLDCLDKANLPKDSIISKKSRYLHFLLHHSYEQVRHCLKEYRLHPTKLSTQTNELYHKIAKQDLKALHGFTTRSMVVDRPWYNKLGFVMVEARIRVLKFLDSILPFSRRHCGNCKEPGHNVRTCPTRPLLQNNEQEGGGSSSGRFPAGLVVDEASLNVEVVDSSSGKNKRKIETAQIVGLAEKKKGRRQRLQQRNQQNLEEVEVEEEGGHQEEKEEQRPLPSQQQQELQNRLREMMGANNNK